ncbi:MAG TPA: PIG-L family deacetylase [Acidimicrobiales bacterium]|nr:PIG-L family deacetylase [Acidimicrobiales bacterium]
MTVSTIVFFHAHPDDESIATGGSIARAAAEGHRACVVTATGGEYGEAPEGVVGPDALRELRAEETHEACRILGVSWGAFLGYTDSGMHGAETNDAPGSFWSADVEEAAAKLAAILREQEADALTIYDDHGGYGHPDHIQVHRVGKRAAELAGTKAVFEATHDRDYFQSLTSRYADAQVDAPGDEGFDLSEFGTPGADITTRIDVRSFLVQKRAAMAAHRSQVGETSFFLALPEELFGLTWGTEYYVGHPSDEPVPETWFF